jgi:hypothetical protein
MHRAQSPPEPPSRRRGRADDFTARHSASTSSASGGAAACLLAATSRYPGGGRDPATDAAAGDIQRAAVTFFVRETGQIIATNVPVVLVNSNDTRVGTVVRAWDLDIGAADWKSFTVATIVHGWYSRNEQVDDTVITVSRPLTSNSVTGGGFRLVVPPASFRKWRVPRAFH